MSIVDGAMVNGELFKTSRAEGLRELRHDKTVSPIIDDALNAHGARIVVPGTRPQRLCP